MKEVQHMAAQGDVLFRRVKEIPKTAVKQETKGPVIVAHSEPGHHHIVDNMEVYRDPNDKDGMICFLQMRDEVDFADVVHHRPYDTHETLRLLGGAGAVWEVRRQREHTPEGWRRVED